MEDAGYGYGGVQEKENRDILLRVSGMMCAHCEGRVKKALEALPFVSAAEADHASGSVKVRLSGPVVEDAVKKAVTEAGYTYEGQLEEPAPQVMTLQVSGMMCAHCEGRVKKALEALPCVTRAEAHHEDGRVELQLSGKLDRKAAGEAIAKAGYELVG